jgi:hypothetical protein
VRGGSASAAGTNEIQGRVERIDHANNITIAGSEQAGLAFDQFKVDSSTEIMKEGAKATIDDINEGDEVRASFSGSGDKLHVERLEILPSAGERGSSASGPTGAGAGEKKESQSPSTGKGQ